MEHHAKEAAVQAEPAKLLARLITTRKARVGTIGLGYVGLPLSAAVAAAGFPVTGFDIDPDKVFIMGYSHGGYGAYAIGPKMPDHFAAIHASSYCLYTVVKKNKKNKKNHCIFLFCQ